MSRIAALLLTGGCLLASLSLGCATEAADDSGGSDAITSKDAKILDFKFSGEVIASESADNRAAVLTQLAYMQGALTTTQSGNGQVGLVVLSNVRAESAGGKKTIKYTASLPVAWPKDKTSPTTYDIVLPKDATALDAFNAKYDGKCGRNEYGLESFWHDWNPKATGCQAEDVDVVRTRAAVTKYAGETTDKYPEYDRMWADGELNVVAMFGIIESNTPSDIGVGEFNDFVTASTRLLEGAATKDTEARGSTILKDTTITGKVTYKGQKRPVNITVLLVEALKYSGPDFDARYEPISEKADLILYNGHAGLGKNVNTLMSKGKVRKGQYQLVLLNGCQTFAYINTTMHDRRIAVNGAADNPKGTKYLDVVANALPGYASNLEDMATAVLTAAAGADRPQSYATLLKDMPRDHIVVVFGEEDNVFKP